MPASAVAAAADKAGRLGAIALGFSIPVSVAADNVLLGLLALCFLARGRYRESWRAVAANPLFLSSLALFAVLAAGTLYGAASAKEAVRYLFKYADLLFIPIVAAFCYDAATRRLGLYALAAALAVTLLLSSALHIGLIPRGPWFVDEPYITATTKGPLVYPVVFKHNLTQAILMALGAFLFALLGAAERWRPLRNLWYVLAIAAVCNMVLLVPGRTGYVILGVLLLYTGYAWWRWKGLALMLSAAMIVFAAGYGVSVPFRQGVDRAVQEYSSWKPGAVEDTSSAVGMRMEFYRNSLAIVRDHPLAGAGTGGFPQAYANQAGGTGAVLTTNPHNEYLLITVQTGVLGLLLMLNLFWQQWRLAPRLASPLETHLARGLVLAIATGCLFNSLLLDHTEGLLYAWLTALLYAGLQSGVIRDER